MRVVNCSINEELQALRHEILARLENCHVLSHSPSDALSVIVEQPPDVLVICTQMGVAQAAALCREFRLANPSGRVVAIVSVPWHTPPFEADVSVDAHSPEALITAVVSYPAMQAQFQRTRRLVLVKSEKWTGWTCERCCWNRPHRETVLDRFSESKIRSEFEAHSCEAFASKTWLKPDSPPKLLNNS